MREAALSYLTPRGVTTYGAAAEAEEEDAVEMADLVESFGLRWCHVGLLLVSWLLMICPAAVVMATPYVLSSLRSEYGVDRATAALVGSAVTLGAVVGTFLFGRVHDMVGRRVCHIMVAVFICIFSLMHLHLPTVGSEEKGSLKAGYAFALLVVLRFVLGIFFPGHASFAALYFVEFLPSQLRGFILTLCTAGWSVGTLYAILVAFALEGNWRMILAAPAPVCIAAVIALWFSPESPRWLYVVGRRDDGHSVLTYIFNSEIIVPSNLDRPWKQPPKHVRVAKDEGKSSNLAGTNSIVDDLARLFEPKLRRTVLACMLLQMAVNGASYAMLIWSADILTQLLGIDHAPYEIFVYSEMVGWIGTGIAACLLDSLGRKCILVASLTATAACVWGLTMVPRTYVWICIMFLGQSMVGGGIWPAMTAYTNECFPTALRGTGSALVQACGRGMAVFFPIFLGAILDNKPGFKTRMPPLETALCVTAGVSILGAVGAALIPQETANAKMDDV